jgi:NRPS condensation-like uncharacterized protein
VTAPSLWPLTAIEELDVYLENPAEPNVIQMETDVGGHLQQADLALALADALAADPAARRRLSPSCPWGRRLFWESTPASRTPVPLTVVRWRTEKERTEQRESLSAWPLRLADGVFRLVLLRGPDGDAVIVHAHHAAFDGVSSLTLLSAIAAAYRDRAGGGPRWPTARPPAVLLPEVTSPAVMPAPPGPGPGPGPGSAGARRQRAGKQRARPVPGAPIRVTPRGGAWRPGYGLVRWTTGIPRPARRGAGPFPTVNDVLVAALILAVRRWNGGGRPGRISVTVPVNARPPGQRWAGPGNQTRLIRVSARPAGCADPAGLLTLVAAQTRAGKEQPGPGLDAVTRLLGSGWAPVAVKRPAARLFRRLAAPVVTGAGLATNLGVVPSPPDFGGTGPPGTGACWFSGPAPMPRGLTISVVTVASRLHLCLTYQHALLDAAAAADFAALCAEAIAELSPAELSPAELGAGDPGDAA